jgi:hypothetical protein
MRYRWADVSQALNNIASRIEQRVNDQEVKQTIAPTVAYVVSATKPEIDNWCYALLPHYGDSKAGQTDRFAKAMLDWIREWTDDKGRTWRDVESKNPQHANSPFYQAAVAECRRRNVNPANSVLSGAIVQAFAVLLAEETPVDPAPIDIPLVSEGRGTLMEAFATPEERAVAAAIAAADEAESQALAAPIDIPDIPQLATRAEVADAFRQWVVSVDDAALRSVRADALLRWRLRHALKASCGGKGISDAFLIEEIDSELERRVPELPEHLRHAEICEADRADLANPAEWVATYNAAVRAETREDRLSQYAALFRECMAAAPPWGELTGRHTVTGEAVRGLRKMLDVTERELALLRGEVVAEMSGE